MLLEESQFTNFKADLDKLSAAIASCEEKGNVDLTDFRVKISEKIKELSQKFMQDTQQITEFRTVFTGDAAKILVYLKFAKTSPLTIENQTAIAQFLTKVKAEVDYFKEKDQTSATLCASILSTLVQIKTNLEKKTDDKKSPPESTAALSSKK